MIAFVLRREVQVGRAGYVAIVSLFSLCSVMLWAQERHLGDDHAGNLYARSSFAHGYIHGYEQGFHNGDLDLQLGRNPRDPSTIHAFRNLSSYANHFGPKHSFRAGYEDGFRAGYSDVFRGLSFRAVDGLRTAGMGLTSPVEQLPEFDSGFSQGYRDGRRQGTNDGRDLTSSNPILPPCLGHSAGYCDGFGRAFLLGYNDGYMNQASPENLVKRLDMRAKK